MPGTDKQPNPGQMGDPTPDDCEHLDMEILVAESGRRIGFCPDCRLMIALEESN